MEWSKFIIVVLVLYACYYAFNIIFDQLKSKNSSNKSEIVPLTFEDDSPVKKVEHFEQGSKDVNNIKETLLSRNVSEIGVINEDVNQERKEEFLTKPDPEPEPIEIDNVVKPTGKIKVIAENIIAGGLSYKELIKQATQGAILKSANIDFGEPV